MTKRGPAPARCLPTTCRGRWGVQLPPRPIASAAPLFIACRTVIADLVQPLAPTALERRGIHPEYGAMRLSDILKLAPAAS